MQDPFDVEPDAIVTDHQLEGALAVTQLDPNVPSLCVPRDVRERFGDDEVDGCLNARGRSLGELKFELHGDRRAQCERFERGSESAVCEERGVDAACELTEFAECLRELGGGGIDKPAARLIFELPSQNLEVDR